MKYQSRLAYRFDLITSAFAFFILQFISIVFIAVIYNAGGTFPGWTLSNIVLLSGTLSLIKGFCFMAFFGILWHTQDLVRSGELDLYLLRPVNTLYFLIMDSFDEEDVGQTIGGITLLIFGFTLNPHLVGSIFLYLLLLIFGILFFLSLALLSSAATIRFINTRRLYEFVDLITLVAGYPKSIYSKTATIIFSTAVPLIIIANVPVSMLLGLGTQELLMSVISVLILTILSVLIWYKTLKRYSSAGG